MAQSENLRIVYAASFATCIPTTIDLLLDTLYTEKSVGHEYRPALLLATVFPSVLYFLLSASMTPTQYLSIYHVGILIFEGIIHSMLIQMSTNRSRNLQLFTNHAIYVLLVTCRTISFIYHTYPSLVNYASLASVSIMTTSTIFNGSSILNKFTLSFFTCPKSTESELKLSDEETVFTWYIIVFTLFTIFFQQTKIYDGICDLKNVDDNYFTLVQIYFMLAGATVNILPGRLAQLQAYNARIKLQTKGTFVRYVSHEIRSPLNVVFAGLEIVNKELAKTSVYPSIKNLVADVYDSSQTAIQLLNDLLQYENIEANTFQLDLSWKSIPNLCGIKIIKTLSLLVDKYNLKLIVDDPWHIFGDSSMISQQHIANNINKDDNSKVIDKNVKDMNHNYKYLSQIDPEKMALHIDICRFDQVIRNLITNAAKFTLEGGSITIRTSIDLNCNKYDPNDFKKSSFETNQNPNPPTLVNSYLDKLKKIVENVLYSKDNQLPKYTNEISEESNNIKIGSLKIEIIDTGVGISPENQKKVFGQFAQFDKNKLQSGNGSGLGLWISKKIAEHHNGYLGFFSEGINKGSNFYVILPIYSPPEDHVLDSDKLQFVPISSKSLTNLIKTPYEKIRITSHSSPRNVIKYVNSINSSRIGFNQDENKFEFPQCKILIVDDCISNRKILKKMIESDNKRFPNVDVKEAVDGNIAVNMTKLSIEADAPYDLIFMDYHMKYMDGPEAVQIIRKQLNYAGIIVGITGDATTNEIEYFKGFGLNDAVSKPFSAVQLFEVIHKNIKKESLLS